MTATTAEKIPLEAVVSSNLAAVGYNPAKQILAVQFAKSGIIIHYAPVPPELAADLGAAESKGAFYAKHIRGKIQGERMTMPCPNCNDEGWIGETCSDCGTAQYTAVPYTPKPKGGAA